MSYRNLATFPKGLRCRLFLVESSVHEADLIATSSLARFGAFELDTERRELRRAGMLIALPGQPFDLLVMLLRRPYELVLRHEIEEKFWAGDRYGDLGGRVNFAIREIRKALDDNADKPRYVATVRNRGYKLIIPVRWLETSNSDAAAQGANQSLGSDTPGDSETRSPARKRIVKQLKSRGLIVAGLALTVVLVAGLAILGRLGNDAVAPVIASVTHIGPVPDQRIVIIGRGFGTHTSYSHQDSGYLAIRDTTAHWAAGRITATNWDEVTLSVASWTDSEIVVTGFSGAYGTQGWKLSVGDKIEIAVWNPQTHAGPGIYHLEVTEEAAP
jgi:DNA-binding winged helix-turn-helix (wHTH) protein